MLAVDDADAVGVAVAPIAVDAADEEDVDADELGCCCFDFCVSFSV